MALPAAEGVICPNNTLCCEAQNGTITCCQEGGPECERCVSGSCVNYNQTIPTGDDCNYSCECIVGACLGGKCVS